MVYKVISEWEDENTHEVMLYKYNYNHDEMVKYWFLKNHNELQVLTFVCTTPQYKETYDLRDGLKKWWNYNKMEVNNK